MRFNRVILVLILNLFILAAIYSSVFAAQDTDTQTSVVTLTIPPTCRLVITNPDATKSIDSDGTSEEAFDRGYTDFDIGNPTLKVFANKNWKLSARSSGFTGPYAKAMGDLQLKDTGLQHVTMTEFTSLSATDQEIGSFAAGVKNEDHPCQYRILLDYDKDIPGTYNATVTYTLTTDAS